MKESGDDEYKGDHSDTEDEVDSDFDIDEGDEPDSDQEDDAPKRKSRVVTKAYKVRTSTGNIYRTRKWLGVFHLEVTESFDLEVRSFIVHDNTIHRVCENRCLATTVIPCVSVLLVFTQWVCILFSFQEPVKVAKPKPKKPSVEQKKIERVKTPQKRTAQVFQDFAESK